jgi:Protein of unknown function (DUF3551)
MRTLILSSSLLAAALIGGPQAAVAQNEYAFCARSATGSLNCVYNTMEQCRQAQVGGSCVANPATTGQAPVTQGPAGGGQFLPPPGQPPATRSEGAVSPAQPGPPGGGQFLPPPSR